MDFIGEIRKLIHSILPQKYRSFPFLLFITIIFSSAVSLFCKALLTRKGYDVQLSPTRDNVGRDIPKLIDLAKREPVKYKRLFYRFLTVLLIFSYLTVLLAFLSGEW